MAVAIVQLGVHMQWDNAPSLMCGVLPCNSPSTVLRSCCRGNLASNATSLSGFQPITVSATPQHRFVARNCVSMATNSITVKSIEQRVSEAGMREATDAVRPMHLSGGVIH